MERKGQWKKPEVVGYTCTTNLIFAVLDAYPVSHGDVHVPSVAQGWWSSPGEPPVAMTPETLGSQTTEK